MCNMRLAIITARGGSKRIPGKNIREFCGKPIIAYSIETALKSGCFDEVMVSTDDEEIADIAKKYGAKVPFMRSARASDDFATTADVLLEVASEYQSRNNLLEYLCCLYPTAPLISVNDIKQAFTLLLNNVNTQTVYPIVKFSFPIQRALELQGSKVEFFNAKYISTRSQDLQQAYHDAGQFYWHRVALSMKNQFKIGISNEAIILPEWQVQDIDTEDDWKMAEIKYLFYRKKIECL